MKIAWVACTDTLMLEGLNGVRRDFGGPGGSFECGDRWGDFLDRQDGTARAHLEALRRDILERGLRRDGAWHQDKKGFGVPMWEDGAVYAGSQRAWGDLMAAVWSTADDFDYWYGDFAWGVDFPTGPTLKDRRIRAALRKRRGRRRK